MKTWQSCLQVHVWHFLAVSSSVIIEDSSLLQWGLCHHNLPPKACTSFMVMFWGEVTIETHICLPNTLKGKFTPQTSESQAVLNTAEQLWHFRIDSRIFIPTIFGG